MAILGAHMSITGGFHMAVERAAKSGCDCVQIFTAAPHRWPIQPAESLKGIRGLTQFKKHWRVKEITDDDVAMFQEKITNLQISHPISHTSYLINLAAPDPEMWQKSVAAFIVELKKAEQLGIPYVVVHPGSYTTSDEATGIKRIAKALDETHKKTSSRVQCLLETTAGQGSNLGWRFEQLAQMLDAVRDPDRVGICVDTCHIFAAGYAMGMENDYKKTMREFNRLIGVKKIKAFHLNDSKKTLGSRVDRHDHIGKGEMGLEPFRHLLNDRRFRKVPMYLETPKGDKQDKKDHDKLNLEKLRGLINDA